MLLLLPPSASALTASVPLVSVVVPWYDPLPRMKYCTPAGSPLTTILSGAALPVSEITAFVPAPLVPLVKTRFDWFGLVAGFAGVRVNTAGVVVDELVTVAENVF